MSTCSNSLFGFPTIFNNADCNKSSTLPDISPEKNRAVTNKNAHTTNTSFRCWTPRGRPFTITISKLLQVLLGRNSEKQFLALSDARWKLESIPCCFAETNQTLRQRAKAKPMQQSTRTDLDLHALQHIRRRVNKFRVLALPLNMGEELTEPFNPTDHARHDENNKNKRRN